MRGQGLPNDIKMGSKSYKNAVRFPLLFLDTFLMYFGLIFERILVTFSTLSKEKLEIREYVILSTAPRREANSRGSKGSFFRQKAFQNLSGSSPVFGSTFGSIF